VWSPRDAYPVGVSDDVAVTDDVGKQPTRPRAGRHPIGPLHPRTALLVTSLVATVIALAVLTLLPMPYAVLVAGPATDTLGQENGTALISISGHITYPTTGRLDLTTVRIYGGEGSRVSPWQMISGWLRPGVSVVPEERIFPPGLSAEQTKEENQLEMASSQESATAAALRTLGFTVAEHMRVVDFADASPSRGILAVGDVILSVDGTAVTGGTELRAALQKVTAGTATRLVVRRDGRELTVAPKTTKNASGTTVLGVIVEPTFAFPFQVKIQIENVGGPSAGTMFALGIIDKLTPGSLTGGRTVAGTGTIDPDGVVGPIGGIRQKMVGAREAGASVFLAPADNCDEVVRHIPDGLSVIRISTLAEARRALDTLAAGTPLDSRELPRCG